MFGIEGSNPKLCKKNIFIWKFHFFRVFILHFHLNLNYHHISILKTIWKAPCMQWSYSYAEHTWMNKSKIALDTINFIYIAWTELFLLFIHIFEWVDWKVSDYIFNKIHRKCRVCLREREKASGVNSWDSGRWNLWDFVAGKIARCWKDI